MELRLWDGSDRIDSNTREQGKTKEWTSSFFVLESFPLLGLSASRFCLSARHAIPAGCCALDPESNITHARFARSLTHA